MKSVNVILAQNNLSGGIGNKGTIPWRIEHDLNVFQHLTMNDAVIMGRRTFESIGNKPLPNRLNIIVSKTLKKTSPNSCILRSYQEALNYCESDHSVTTIWVIGGSRLYEEAFSHRQTTSLYVTNVLRPFFVCDTFIRLPRFDEWKTIEVSRVYQEKGVEYQFTRWSKEERTGIEENEENEEKEEKGFLRMVDSLRRDEHEYLNLVHKVIKECNTLSPRVDRTLVGTHSTFGYQCRYNLEKCFPLFTTKRTFWKGIVCELLWMISGSTDSKILENQGVTIWKGNGSRNFLDKNGFVDRKEGDLGPIYGFQWRHFGAKYRTSSNKYDNEGVDQLKNIINEIKTNPTSRRIILSAWNVSDLSSMALPPCHILCQFYVDTVNSKLSCHLYQRSCDLGLGVPFNVASYSLLTHMIAHLCGLGVGEFIHSMGDAHVYSNHVEALKKQLKRSVRKGPTLRIVGNVSSIDEFGEDNFELIGYRPHSTIAMQMAV